jgi:uncharacterized protein YggU (UPF0235/DUF167 family)
VDGKATRACLEACARAFSVRRRDVTLVAGALTRAKVIDVTGRGDDELRRALCDLLGD